MIDRLARPATAFLALLFVAMALVALYTILVREYIQWYGWLSKALFHGLPIAAAGVILVCLLLESEQRVKVSLALIALALPLLGIEAALTVFGAESPEGGVDARTYTKVLAQLQAEGRPATWNLLPRQFLSHELEDRSGERLFPLGGIADRLIVLCNETGDWVLYRSDAHGFHNIGNPYAEKNLSIAAIGDSFLQGVCVEADEDLIGLLRRKHPKVLNLGMSGNGPLLKLASLREYAKPFEPRVVLWFYYEGNDLTDLEREKEHDQLLAYLSPEFSQHLLARREEVQRALVDFEETEVRGQLTRAEAASWREALWQLRLHTVIKVLTFSRFREELQWSPTGESKTDARDFELLKRVLAQARAEVGEWGGSFYFVYLCEKSRFVRFGSPNPYREDVLALVGELGIPVIDACRVFENEPEPLTLFQGHYTPAGYSLIVDEILAALEAESTRLDEP